MSITSPVIKAIKIDQPPLNNALRRAYKEPNNPQKIQVAALGVFAFMSSQTSIEDLYYGLSATEIATLFVLEPVSTALELRKKFGEPEDIDDFTAQLIVYHGLIDYFASEDVAPI